jgi:dTDP-glucose 4,6-dehydratase/UDP-glucuronate decarboxylase
MNGYLRALLSPHQGEPFNIGADQPEISMGDLAAMVIKVTGRPLRVEHRQSDDPKYLTDNPQRRCPSLEKSRRLLGYEPRVPLLTGLELMHQYYLSNPAAEDK